MDNFWPNFWPAMTTIVVAGIGYLTVIANIKAKSREDARIARDAVIAEKVEKVAVVAKEEAKVVAAAVEKVAEKQQEDAKNLALLPIIHINGNANLGATLHEVYIARLALSLAFPDHEEHKQAAETAKVAWLAHQEQQRKSSLPAEEISKEGVV